MEAGAARELAAATGLNGLPLEYTRSLDFTDQRGLRVRQFVFTVVVPDGTPVALSPDHDDYRWAPADGLPPTSDGQRTVIEWLAGRLALSGWRPVGGYIGTIARPSSYGCFLVTDPQGRVLGMRSTVNPGVWNFPRGKVEVGERLDEAAARELREETGLLVGAEDLRLVHTVQVRQGWDGQGPFLLSVFLATAWCGELTNTEPDKHLAVTWSPADALPLPMFPTAHAALGFYLSGGRGFSTHGWDEEPFDPGALVGA